MSACPTLRCYTNKRVTTSSKDTHFKERLICRGKATIEHQKSIRACKLGNSEVEIRAFQKIASQHANQASAAFRIAESRTRYETSPCSPTRVHHNAGPWSCKLFSSCSSLMYAFFQLPSEGGQPAEPPVTDITQAVAKDGVSKV